MPAAVRRERAETWRDRLEREVGRRPARGRRLRAAKVAESSVRS